MRKRGHWRRVRGLRRAKQRRLLSALTVSLLLPLGLHQSLRAQSGRLSRRAERLPGAAANFRGERTPHPRKRALLVAGHLTAERLLESADQIFLHFVRRLNESPDFAAASLGPLKRKEVTKRARTEGTKYVVWLEMEPDKFQDGYLVINTQDLVLKYYIFAPGTGEVLAKGKLYYQAMSGGRRRRDKHPAETPIKITAEAAGIEAAERVMENLNRLE